jgi:membrane protease YdiL (CAAX protease family)
VLVTLLREYGGERFSNDEAFSRLLIGTLAVHGSMVVMIAVFLHWHRVPCGFAFGWSKPDRWHSLTIAILAAFVIIPIIWLLQMVSVFTLTRVGWPPEMQSAVEFIRGTTIWWKRAYLAFFAILLAPVVEEFLFRGTLYPLLMQAGYRRTAWFGVSLVFALVHYNAATFLPLFALALALTWLYDKTDNLLAPMMVHSLFNAANFALLLQQDMVFSSTPDR